MKQNKTMCHRNRALYKAQNGQCYLCGKPMKHVTQDHVIPKSKGGGDYKNVLLTHESCNQNKNDRYPTQQELKTCVEIYNTIPAAFVGYQRRADAAAKKWPKACPECALPLKLVQTTWEHPVTVTQCRNLMVRLADQKQVVAWNRARN